MFGSCNTLIRVFMHHTVYMFIILCTVYYYYYILISTLRSSVVFMNGVFRFYFTYKLLDWVFAIFGRMFLLLTFMRSGDGFELK